VKLQVRQAFFNCLRARELLEVAKQRESQVAGHLKDAQSYYEAGTAAKVDVLRAQVEVANAGYQTLAAENGVDLAFIALKNLLNLGQDVSLDLKVPEVPKLVEPDLGRCLETATTKRPDLLGAGFNVELAEAKVALAASETKPTVALAGTKQWTTASTFSSESPWSVSLVATAPLFDGGTGRAKVEGARRERNQAQLDLQALQQAVEAQVRSAFLSLESNRKQMEAAQVAIEQAKEALRITELQYAEGVARAIEVLDAEVALAQASSNRVNAVYDYETAKAQLAQATGVDSLDELANKPVSGSSVQAPGVTAAPGKE
jgi:outer membrane protein TolC